MKEKSFLEALYNDASCEEVYSKPELQIVKFMFESDITLSSIGSGHEGETTTDPGDDWWD